MEENLDFDLFYLMGVYSIWKQFIDDKERWLGIE